MPQTTRSSELDLHEILVSRQQMDRRRVEEGFLLMATIESSMKHGLMLTHMPYDRNEMVEMITEPFHECFVRKWGGKFLVM